MAQSDSCASEGLGGCCPSRQGAPRVRGGGSPRLLRHSLALGIFRSFVCCHFAFFDSPILIDMNRIKKHAREHHESVNNSVMALYGDVNSKR